MTEADNIHNDQLSDCCKAPYRSICADEGTCHAECTKCNKPCSFASLWWKCKECWLDSFLCSLLQDIVYEDDVTKRVEMARQFRNKHKQTYGRHY